MPPVPGRAGQEAAPPTDGADSAAPDRPAAQHPRRAGSLAGRAAAGGTIMMVQALASQVIAIGGFIVLGWLLDEATHGLFVQTVAVAMFASLAQQIGVRSILLGRPARLDAMAGPSALLLLVLGSLAGLGIALAAPFVERAWDSPGLAPLIRVIAISTPFAAVSIVAECRLQAHLQFRMFAAIQFVRLSGEMLGMVGMALAGFGPMALVVPRTVSTVASAAAMWAIARPPLRLPRPRSLVRRLRRLVSDSRHLLVASLATYAGGQADRISLSFFHSAGVVGIYAFAVSLSSRPALVLDRSLLNVLLPVLGQMRSQPHRQATAFVRANRAVAAITLLPCVGLALAADPIMHAIMHPRWIPAIPVLQFLAIAAAANIVGRSSSALLDGQGRFRTRMILNLVHVGFVVLTVLPAARFGAVATAAAVAGVLIVMCPVRVFVAVIGGGLGGRDVARMLLPPTGAAALAALPTLLVSMLMPATTLGHWLELAIIPIVFTPVYAAGLRVMSPATYAEVVSHLRSLLARVRRGRARGRGRGPGLGPVDMPVAAGSPVAEDPGSASERGLEPSGRRD